MKSNVECDTDNNTQVQTHNLHWNCVHTQIVSTPSSPNASCLSEFKSRLNILLSVHNCHFVPKSIMFDEQSFTRIARTHQIPEDRFD